MDSNLDQNTTAGTKGRIQKIKNTVQNMRPSEKALFGFISIFFIFSFIYIINSLNNKYSMEVPVSGGTYQEGIIGYARFINPLLSYSDADKDMTALIYSGLLKASSDGKLVNDLAESWSISEDGLTYTVILKPNLTFHDGKPLTTEDVEFTIEKARDPAIKSPKASGWNGVKIEKINDREIKFTIQKPYSPFSENMTLGILPKHIWKNIDNESFDINTYNREPIGSGPYKIKRAYRSESGIYEYYNLIPFKQYALGEAYIENLVVRFYKNESDAIDAYENGDIQGLGGILPESANDKNITWHSVVRTPLPRTFALFLNQSSAPVLVNKEVRKALDLALNKQYIIEQILYGFGSIAQSAIPNGLLGNPELSSSNSVSDSVNETATSSTIEAGKKILLDNGWKLNSAGIFEKQTKSGGKTETQTLRFSISTTNIPELKKTAELLKDTWSQMGADVKVEIFEPSDLNQKVIRPRKYDALLFGNVVSRDLDLYPFWHSSERNDPGLNIALYTNIKADKALELARSTTDDAKKTEALKAFVKEVNSDIPAIFLYSPDYIYATTGKVKNLNITNMTTSSERFMNINKWYIETEKIWKVFAK